MIEIEIHGFGGQGVQVLGVLLTNAAVKAGHRAHAFSEYGPDIMGGQVECFVRISDETINVHSHMYEPDYIVLVDEIYSQKPGIVSGLKESGEVLINSPDPPDAFSALGNVKITTIDAHRIAIEQELVSTRGLTVSNTVLLGAIAGMIPFVGIDDVAEAISAGGIPNAEKNIQAAREAFRIIESHEVVGVAVGKRELPKVFAGVFTKPYTGSFPVFDLEKMPRCNRCLICYISCPDLAIKMETDPFSLSLDQRYCKQCGICINECPRLAISWGEEV